MSESKPLDTRRQQLLNEARASLLSTRGRPLSGTGPAPKSLTVSWDALPGALCLLREVGSALLLVMETNVQSDMATSIRKQRVPDDS